jgi:hypothetical protein
LKNNEKNKIEKKKKINLNKGFFNFKKLDEISPELEKLINMQ